jgi:hypothetical protein
VWLVIAVVAMSAFYLSSSIRTLVARRSVTIGTARVRARVAKVDFRAWAACEAASAVGWPVFISGMATHTVWLMMTGLACLFAGAVVMTAGDSTIRVD